MEKGGLSPSDFAALAHMYMGIMKKDSDPHAAADMTIDEVLLPETHAYVASINTKHTIVLERRLATAVADSRKVKERAAGRHAKWVDKHKSINGETPHTHWNDEDAH